MKQTHILILSGLLLCGCSQQPQTPTSSAGPAIDQIQSGRTVSWADGHSILRVAHRDGNSLKGIQIINTETNGQKTTITAATGTVTPGSAGNSGDESSVTLTLQGVRSLNGPKVMNTKEMTLVLHE